MQKKTRLQPCPVASGECEGIACMESLKTCYIQHAYLNAANESEYIHTYMRACMCGYVCKHAWFGAFMSDVYIQMRAFPRTFPLVFVGESDEHRQMTMQTCMPIFGMW